MTEQLNAPQADPDLNCRDIVEVVTDYLEGALPDADRRRFEDHLGICDECVVYVDQVRDTIAAVGATGGTPEALPPGLREGLRRAFHDWAN